MGLTTAEQSLLIFLSAFLAIIFILGIVALVYLIKIQQTIKRIIDKVENVTNKASAMSDFFGKSAPFVSLYKFLVDKAKRNKK